MIHHADQRDRPDPPVAERTPVAPAAGPAHPGDDPAAEDVTQSLWLRVQRVEDDPPIANKRAYLYRLAANLATDQLRATRRHDALFEASDAPADASSPPPRPNAACSTARG
jgi:DNA-directed RNA polymerase specialized sigma24 family protein